MEIPAVQSARSAAVRRESGGHNESCPHDVQRRIIIPSLIIYPAIFAALVGCFALAVTGTLAILNVLLGLFGVAAIAISLKLVFVPATLIAAIVWFLSL